MKGSTILLLAAGGALLYFLYTKIRTVTNLSFVPRGVSSSGAGLLLTVGVQNPTSTPVTLRSIVGNLFIDGNPVANVSDFSTAVIAANAETPIQILVQPDLYGIVSSVVSTIKNGLPSNSQISLQGTANIDNSAMPVNTKFV
jgi:LEA14-like dessication related protein